MTKNFRVVSIPHPGDDIRFRGNAGVRLGLDATMPGYGGILELGRNSQAQERRSLVRKTDSRYVVDFHAIGIVVQIPPGFIPDYDTSCCPDEWSVSCFGDVKIACVGVGAKSTVIAQIRDIDELGVGCVQGLGGFCCSVLSEYAAAELLQCGIIDRRRCIYSRKERGTFVPVELWLCRACLSCRPAEDLSVCYQNTPELGIT